MRLSARSLYLLRSALAVLLVCAQVFATAHAVGHLGDLATLARAEEAEVLALWSGLGYYRRCRGLIAAARQLVAGEGRLPATYEVVYGHAWRSQPRKMADGRTIVRFDPHQRLR